MKDFIKIFEHDVTDEDSAVCELKAKRKKK